MVTTLGDYGLRIASVDAPQEFIGGSFAKCNGSSDADVINDAIDWVRSHSNYGGIIRLSPGRFSLSSAINMKSGIYLVGSGRAGMNSDSEGFAVGTEISMQNLSNSPGITLTDTSVSHLAIRDLWLNGNSSVQDTAQIGINLDWTGLDTNTAHRPLIENVGVINFGSFGVLILKPSGFGGGAADLHRVFAIRNGDDGFRIQGSDVFATHCNALGNGGDGWQFASGGANTQVVNSKADSNDGWGFNVSGSPRQKLFGIEALNNAQGGIIVNQNDCTVSGALIIDNGRNGGPDPGLRAQSGCIGLVATGMTITEVQGDSRMSVGVQVDSGADNILVGGMVTNYVTAYLQTDSVGSTVSADGLIDGDA